MPRRFLLAALLGCACQPVPVERPPGWHEATAVCAADAPPHVIARRQPDLRFKEAIAAAARVAVSRDLKIATDPDTPMDLELRAVSVRMAAMVQGVTNCPLADALQAQVDATPGPLDVADAVVVLEAAGSVAPEALTPILAAACAEIPACGRECAPGLAAMAAAAPGWRFEALAKGCGAFSKQQSLGEAGAVSFTHARVTDFLNECAPKFDPAAAARVQELRARLQL
ncbi:hypothetical protein [Nannocystis pusilla]|uniref:Lipoprotein n=1 Tax=Nannocystis pusilla TaxID=889268 RepID=A0ABS7TK40_9BACT|nr:hypothetical protein [Nannocystis pusilla]MBZ5708497.1 hypothetical protein [Nannocystis pusilla]